MIQKSTFDFLSNLKQHNHKEWMDANKSTYLSAKTNMIQFTKALIGRISAFDPAIAAAHLDEKKCTFRINRDIRFSTDKTPYKTNFFAVISKGGKKSPSAFYFICLEPGNCFLGGGVYQPMPEHLKKIREELDYSFDELKTIIENPAFKKQYPDGLRFSSELKKMPAGFREDSPAGDLLKRKDYYAYMQLPDEVFVQPEVLATIMPYFEAAKPVVDYLNRALEYTK